jgi:hypothetical protein
MNLLFFPMRTYWRDLQFLDSSNRYSSSVQGARGLMSAMQKASVHSQIHWTNSLPLTPPPKHSPKHSWLDEIVLYRLDYAAILSTGRRKESWLITSRKFLDHHSVAIQEVYGLYHPSRVPSNDKSAAHELSKRT